MNDERLQFKHENYILSAKLNILNEQIAVNAAMPRLAHLRDRVLSNLKMGRQSTAGKAINAFIKELMAVSSTTQWQVGDQCSVIMPSGVVITDAVVASIQHEHGTCKVHVPSTNSHFTAELSDLLKA